MIEIVVATCLLLKGQGVSFGAFPKITTSKLAGFFLTLSLYLLSAKQKSCEYHFFKSILVRPDKGIKSTSTACIANALTDYVSVDEQTAGVVFNVTTSKI